MVRKITAKSVRLKRAYESAAAGDGMRILVDRLWPRGVNKADAAIDHWVKDLAPSTRLRKWFAHDPEKWPQFQRRYFTELKAHEHSLQPLRKAARQGPVTLVFSSHDTEHNAAVALRDYLQTHAAP